MTFYLTHYFQKKLNEKSFNSFFHHLEISDGRNPETYIIQARVQFPVSNGFWLGTIITDLDYKVRVQNPFENRLEFEPKWFQVGTSNLPWRARISNWPEGAHILFILVERHLAMIILKFHLIIQKRKTCKTYRSLLRRIWQ